MATPAESIELRQAAASTTMLSRVIGEWAEGKGFREDWLMAGKLETIAAGKLGDEPIYELGNEELRDILVEAADMLRNNVIGTKLMLIVSECSEALETLRTEGAQGVMAGHGNFGEEMADAEIRIKDLMHLTGLDLGQEEVAKVAKNVDRPFKHGRKL